MKKIIGIGILLMLVFSVQGQSYKKLVEFGDEQFNSGDYYGAIRFYQQALEMGDENLSLLYKYAESLRKFNHYKKAAEIYDQVHVLDVKDDYKLCVFWLATMQKNLGEYEKSKKSWTIVQRQFQAITDGYEFKKATQEIASCEYAIEHRGVGIGELVEVLKDSVNTKGSEFAAFLIDSSLYFSSMRADSLLDEMKVEDEEYRVKLFQSNFQKDSFNVQEVRELDRLNDLFSGHVGNGNYNSGTKSLYFTVCDEKYQCQIYRSKRNEEEDWLKPELVKGKINVKGFTSTHPTAMSWGGSEILLFSSDREGGIGKMDIWMARSNGHGEFGEVINLGSEINSIGNEVTPIFRKATKKLSLYFASDWHQGFGGFDIFKSENFKLYENDLIDMDLPKNLGNRINSSANDLYYYPISKYTGVLSSNRNQMQEDSDLTCCPDIFTYKLPIPIIKPPRPVIWPAVTLYFHNDRPNPDNWLPTTDLNYMETYNKYEARRDEYKEAHAGKQEGDVKQKAEEKVDEFFNSYVKKGVNDLNRFVDVLKEQLKKGFNIEVTIQGFASPLAKTNYNVFLTGRRVHTLLNFFNEYEDGYFLPYIENKAENGGSLSFVRVKFGEYTSGKKEISDDFKDTRNSVYSIHASLERKIQIIDVKQSKRGSKYSEMVFENEVFDFGTQKKGEEIEAEFLFTNTGNSNLELSIQKLDSLDIEILEYPEIVPPKENGVIKIKLKTENLLGIEFREITFRTNTAALTKKLTLTCEVKE